jgi:hypothetical protein
MKYIFGMMKIVCRSVSNIGNSSARVVYHLNKELCTDYISPKYYKTFITRKNFIILPANSKKLVQIFSVGSPLSFSSGGE